MIGGNPPDGISACACGGIAPAGIKLIALLIVGIMTPGCVRNTTKNVPAYP
jgi:hypothetical protein